MLTLILLLALADAPKPAPPCSHWIVIVSDDRGRPTDAYVSQEKPRTDGDRLVLRVLDDGERGTARLGDAKATTHEVSVPSKRATVREVKDTAGRLR